MSTRTTDPKTGITHAPPESPDKSKAVAATSSGKARAAFTKWKGDRTTVGLTPAQTVLAGYFLFVWLNLFAGGMLVDTAPYRCAVSWRAVEAISPDKPLSAHPCNAYWTWDEKEQRSFFNRPVFADGGGRPFMQPLMTWLLAMLFYTPLNLAFISTDDVAGDVLVGQFNDVEAYQNTYADIENALAAPAPAAGG